MIDHEKINYHDNKLKSSKCAVKLIYLNVKLILFETSIIDIQVKISAELGER